MHLQGLLYRNRSEQLPEDSVTELRCLLRQRIVYGMAEADQTDLSRSGRSFIEAALILLPHTRQDAIMYLSDMA